MFESKLSLVSQWSWGEMILLSVILLDGKKARECEKKKRGMEKV